MFILKNVCLCHVIVKWKYAYLAVVAHDRIWRDLLKSWHTSARGQVINNLTNSILATYSWTGIEAFVSYTCLIGGTVRVKNTLRSTTFIGITYVLGKATTRPCVILLLTNGIGSTRWRGARRYNFTGWCWNRIYSFQMR